MFASEDGPAPDRAVLRALHRLDDTVYPVWRTWAMNPITGKRLYRERSGTPIHDPKWYIMKVCRDGRDRLLFTVPYFDYRVVRRLESDLGRLWEARKLQEWMDRQQQEQEEKGQKQWSEEVGDFVGANKRKFQEMWDNPDGLSAEPRLTHRDQRIASYHGQGNRTSGRASVPVTAKEAGFEMPWEDDEEQE